jgi:SAM-dependent methyltransferase
MDSNTRHFSRINVRSLREENLQNLYPSHIRQLALRHWTPLAITQKVVQFLTPANDGSKVLDIGSGTGHFCLAAALYRPLAYFFGVEQRKDLVAYAEEGRKQLELQNVFFIHGNFTTIDFRKFDHFYFYNSFYENLEGTDKIDVTIGHSPELYDYYNLYLNKKLEDMPEGTRIATFNSLDFEIPSCYSLVKSELSTLLKFWIKRGA